MHHEYKHKFSPGLDKLWVITVISNPVRYKSRYELFKRFKKQVKKAGANLLVVELALGNRPFEITRPNHPYHIQLRTNDELWHKENLINLGISRLPIDWEYVAWVDADITFLRDDWVEEIPHQLQHYKLVQLFQNAIDLGPKEEVLKLYDGFVWAYLNHQAPPYTRGRGYGPHWHPGFAWAATRDTIDHLGGLIDTAIMGAADHHMAWALLGKVVENTPQNLTPGYMQPLLLWQDRAVEHIRQNIGYMPGSIAHHWHGKKQDRRYVERWDVIIKHKYDPYKDLKKDWQGVYMFTHEGQRMRNDIREYFRMRNEDSIDL